MPCQDISYAGKGAGITGERSGLWYEYARLIGELRPRYVLVENVAALLGRGLSDVLGSLASLGYDAEWHCIPASAVGAPHIRDRVWVLAYNALGGWCHKTTSFQRSHRECWGPQKPYRGLCGDDFFRGCEWVAEPHVDRVADGIPHAMDRLAALGNAVVPKIPELIGRAIIVAEAAP